MSRAKGTPNKRSQMLLKELENDHNFKIVPKIIRLYNDTDAVYTPLVERLIQNVEAKVSPTLGFTEEEVGLLNKSRKDMHTILQKFLAYCYPRLKATEVNLGDGDHITFNINSPGVEVSSG